MFFSNRNFNQNISSWDVSNVVNMMSMLSNAESFDQDLSGWNISNVLHIDHMFSGTTLSTSNYDAILNAWSELSLNKNLDFDGGHSKYSENGEIGRTKLIETHKWTITDGGKE